MSLPNPLEKLESGHNIALSYSNLSTIMASMSGVVWMGSKSVWGCLDTKSVGKHLY